MMRIGEQIPPGAVEPGIFKEEKQKEKNIARMNAEDKEKSAPGIDSLSITSLDSSLSLEELRKFLGKIREEFVSNPGEALLVHSRLVSSRVNLLIE